MPAPMIASGRLALIDEASVNGLGDVPGSLRDPVRDANGGLRAVPYLWSPQLLLARRSVFGEQPPTSLRALFSQRGAARAALPDSPLELALAARYLGIGDAFALGSDELAAAREVLAPAQPLLHFYARCGDAALALPPRRDRPRARQPGDARRPARGRVGRRSDGGHDRDRARARDRLGHAARASARGASPARCSRPAAQARLAAARGLVPVRSATCNALAQPACKALKRALSQTLANSAVAVHPVAADGVTGWPEWVGEWVLLHGG